MKKKPSSRSGAVRKRVAGKKGRRPAAGTEQPGNKESAQGPVAVVGVGASAGGLTALEAFLEGMPPETGAAFVIVTHQHPGHTSLLPELLRKHTQMTVREVGEGVRLEPNIVYLSRPESCVGLERGTLRLSKLSATTIPHLTIDHFFRALAEDQKERAVGIVLSGTGTDGTLGLRAIKGVTGMTMVQSPDSARYAGMPQSAMATGLIDIVAAADRMGPPLLAYLGVLAKEAPAAGEWEHPAATGGPMQRIYVLLRHRTGHDFSNYKSNTIRRRIERRMSLLQIPDAARYVHFLHEHPHEIDLLFKELLIGVTSFFRDVAAYEALVEQAVRPALEAIPGNEPVRVWVPGCSSGEEAYSLAITIHECTEKLNKFFHVQVFGTDLDDEAINVARAGLYPEGIAADVPTARLKRYFVHEDGGYRIRKQIRETLVFATQNVLKDPPFTKLDLISCRNLLIYLDADAQRRMLALFHYALKPDGVLFLGPSESVTSLDDGFAPIEKRWKIYRRKPAVPTSADIAQFPSAYAVGRFDQTIVPTERTAAPAPTAPLSSVIERTLLQRIVPPSVVTNERGDIVHVHGRTGDFLEPAAGGPRLNLFEMAREGLRVELTAALRHAAAP